MYTSKGLKTVENLQCWFGISLNIILNSPLTCLYESEQQIKTYKNDLSDSSRKFYSRVSFSVVTDHCGGFVITNR